MVTLLLGGCGGDSSEDQLLVSAAASLTDAFESIEEAFEEANPGVDVMLNVGGSSALREQILEGAPADVFASANIDNMDQVVRAGGTSAAPEVFARNTLQIAVPSGNPAGVTGLEAFADESLFVGLCAEGVPCGDSARRVLSHAGVDPAVDTNEPDVRALLTKIEVGELDLAITYVTDIASTEGAVEGIDIAPDVNVVTEYPIAPLSGATNPDAADAFIEFVLSEEGRSILAAFGFSTP